MGKLIKAPITVSLNGFHNCKRNGKGKSVSVTAKATDGSKFEHLQKCVVGYDEECFLMEIP